ncbi:MAG: hypothetical protein IT462_13205, partial [Planctomycetes bacterium]|nr:hypothetical protein [Planctomycetota bacterium]
MRYILMILFALLAAPLAAQDKEWKHREEIDLGRVFTRKIKLEQESYVRVKAVKEAKFKCDFVEGEETYEFSGWRKLPKGDYTVRVTSSINEQGKVRLTVLKASDVDPNEPVFEDWRYGVAQKIGAPFEVSLLPESDVDYFVVDIDERTYVRVEAYGALGATPEAAIHWLDPQGKPLEPSATEGRELTPGQWILAVACTAKDLVEPYRVKTFIQNTDVFDANEPNDTRDNATALALDKRIVGALQTSVDADWFCFDAPDDGVV